MVTLLQMILFFALLLTIMIVVSLLGKRFREQNEAKQRQLTDEEKGIVWIEDKEGKPLPIDKEGGFIRFEELLK